MNFVRSLLVHAPGRHGGPVRLLWLALAWCAASSPALAAGMSEESKREVGELLSRIERSPCEFNRSGTWYSGPQARSHLQRKYMYLSERGKLGSAEDFVALAASKSSITGEPYLIRCGSAAPITSAVWLEGELRRVRAMPAAVPR
jgi:Family of unknown function (DUF5329)